MSHKTESWTKRSTYTTRYDSYELLITHPSFTIIDKINSVLSQNWRQMWANIYTAWSKCEWELVPKHWQIKLITQSIHVDCSNDTRLFPPLHARQFWLWYSFILFFLPETKFTSVYQVWDKTDRNSFVSVITKIGNSDRILPVIVPTPLEGEGTIYSNEFFLFRQFWPIDIFIVESCEWYH